MIEVGKLRYGDVLRHEYDAGRVYVVLGRPSSRVPFAMLVINPLSYRITHLWLAGPERWSKVA